MVHSLCIFDGSLDLVLVSPYALRAAWTEGKKEQWYPTICVKGGVKFVDDQAERLMPCTIPAKMNFRSAWRGSGGGSYPACRSSGSKRIASLGLIFARHPKYLAVLYS